LDKPQEAFVGFSDISSILRNCNIP